MNIHCYELTPLRIENKMRTIYSCVELKISRILLSTKEKHEEVQRGKCPKHYEYNDQDMHAGSNS